MGYSIVHLIGGMQHNMSDLENLQQLVLSESEEDTRTENEKEKRLYLVLSEEYYTKLMQIHKYYRSPNFAHTIRLMIEDFKITKQEEEETLG